MSWKHADSVQPRPSTFHADVDWERPFEPSGDVTAVSQIREVLLVNLRVVGHASFGLAVQS